MSATETNDKTKARPVIKGVAMTESGWKDTIALWLTNENATAKLKGFIMDGDTKVSVLGFINDNTEKGTKFITLSKSTPDGLVRVCTGNPINSHKDESPVFFDTLGFNIGDKSVYGRLTKAASAELQAELGFAQARVARPARPEHAGDGEAAMAMAGDDADDQTAVAQPRERG